MSIKIQDMIQLAEVVEKRKEMIVMVNDRLYKIQVYGRRRKDAK